MVNKEIGGYSFNFIESPPDEFVCLICHLVARDPQQLLCCGKAGRGSAAFKTLEVQKNYTQSL